MTLTRELSGGTSTLSAADIINSTRALQPEILARGDEIASLRRLPSDRHIALQPRVAGAVHLAHAACANRSDHFVRAEARTGRD